MGGSRAVWLASREALPERPVAPSVCGWKVLQPVVPAKCAEGRVIYLRIEAMDHRDIRSSESPQIWQVQSSLSSTAEGWRRYCGERKWRRLLRAARKAGSPDQ